MVARQVRVDTGMSDGRSDGRSDETNISRRCPARHRDPIHIHSKLPSIEDELEGEEEDVDYTLTIARDGSRRARRTRRWRWKTVEDWRTVEDDGERVGLQQVGRGGRMAQGPGRGGKRAYGSKR